MESILTSTKKLLGISQDDDSFDTDIIFHINTAFSILSQMGIGPEEGFRITDDTTMWSDYTQDDIMLEMVKSYIPMKVRKMFDPPTSSAVMECLNKIIEELEQRLYIEFEIRKKR